MSGFMASKLENTKNKIKRKAKRWASIIGIIFLLIATVLYVLPKSVIYCIGSFIDNMKVYEQECPELVHAYLQDNYEEFERNIRVLCDDKDFEAFVTALEFDTAYTKLIYGDTKNYTQEELKANYEGGASYITKKGDKYYMSSVIDKINSYQEKGIENNQIKIRDEYLTGYPYLGYKTDDVMNLNNWLKSSFYTVPYYFWYGRTLQTDLSFGFKDSSERDAYSFEYPFLPVSNSGFISYFEMAKEKTYEDVLKNYIKSNLQDKVSRAFLEETIETAPLSTKRTYSKDFIEKIGSVFTEKDIIGTKENNEYLIPASNMKTFDKWINKNLDLFSVNEKECERYGKRQGQTNELIEVWKDNFAKYLAYEIYYNYGNRQWIEDNFLGKKVPHSKKVAFLQKSLYAMFTGSSLNLTMGEEYSLQEGNIYNAHTGDLVGEMEIENITVTKVEMVSAAFSLSLNASEETIKQHHVDEQGEVTSEKKLKKLYGKYINNKEYRNIVKYVAEIHVTPKIGKEIVLKSVPVSFSNNEEGVKIFINALTMNNLGVRSDKENYYNGKDFGKELEKSKAIQWEKTYYEQQYEDVKGTEEEVDRKNNPLDKLRIRCDDWSWSFSSTYEEGSLSTSSIKTVLNNEFDKYKQDKTGAYAMLDGKLTGSRKFEYEYSERSFLSYSCEEQKDSMGKIMCVNIEVFMQFPDTSKMSDEYRIAHGFETEGAIEESIKLYNYFKKNNTLKGVSDVVDFSQIIITDSDNYINNGYVYDASDLLTFTFNLIVEVESNGNWKSARNAFAQFPGEKTITVGVLQWYGGRAHNLLREIVKSVGSKGIKEIFKKYMDEKASINLYKNILGKDDWEGERKSFNENELKAIKDILGTEKGMKEQRKQGESDISGYFELCKKTYGISDNRLLMFFAVMHHQSPRGAQNVMNTFLAKYSSQRDANSDNKGLENLYKCCINNSTFSSFIRRYKVTYNKCKEVKTKIGTSETSGKASKAIKFALSKLGCKYSQSKRNGKTIFDCSNLIWASWNHAGIDMGKGANTETILRYCESKGKKICVDNVDSSKLSAGDILFYDGNAGHYKGVNHVSMYIGDNKIVEANSAVGKVITKELSNSNGKNSSFMVAYRLVETSHLFVWPVPEYNTLSSDYGDTAGRGKPHEGIDIPAPSGTKIIAASSGIVEWANYSTSAGNWIGINHGNGIYTIYMHQSKIKVKTGQKVEAGDVIGYVGTTGYSTGNHLHFSVKVNGKYVNPHDYVSPK